MRRPSQWSRSSRVYGALWLFASAWAIAVGMNAVLEGIAITVTMYVLMIAAAVGFGYAMVELKKAYMNEVFDEILTEILEAFRRAEDRG